MFYLFSIFWVLIHDLGFVDFVGLVHIFTDKADCCMYFECSDGSGVLAFILLSIILSSESHFVLTSL